MTCSATNDQRQSKGKQLQTARMPCCMSNDQGSWVSGAGYTGVATPPKMTHSCLSTDRTLYDAHLMAQGMCGYLLAVGAIVLDLQILRHTEGRHLLVAELLVRKPCETWLSTNRWSHCDLLVLVQGKVQGCRIRSPGSHVEALPLQMQHQDREFFRSPGKLAECNITLSTFPTLPLSLPPMTTTVSPLRTCTSWRTGFLL